MYVVTLEKSPFLLLFNEVQNHLEFLGSNKKMDGRMSTDYAQLWKVKASSSGF